MITIDISGKNRALYDGRVGSSKGAFHIELNGQEAVDVVARNVLRIISTIPEDERDEILITGIAPRDIALAVALTAKPHFKVVKHFNGKEIVTFPSSYIQPPPDLPQCNEGEG